MGTIINYPTAEGAVLQKDFRVRVRAAGQEEWQEVSCYQVKVDMHEVRAASMAYFDFSGEVDVEITCPKLFYIYQVDVRPLSAGITAAYDTKKILLHLDRPVKLSVEVNRERFHNLHLIAGRIREDKPEHDSNNTVYLPGGLQGVSVHRTEELVRRLERMPGGRCVCFGPGLHYLEECSMRIPTDTQVYLEGGAVVVGTFIISHTENIRIYGRGCLYLAGFERFSGLNAIRISHGKNVRIEGIHLLNPPHYSVYIGGSQRVWVEDITAFSCEGWSDGIDIMSSTDIEIRDCFLRTSDDCVAIYGRRWDYNGDSRRITVSGCCLWADVAHPLNIGTHGDYEHDGNVIEDIRFENLDILEHREPQAGYLGCMAINAGDKNTVRNISYENIRIEPFQRGKLMDIQVKRNPDYNPAPGNRIEHVRFKDIYYTGPGEEKSCIRGYDGEHMVSDVTVENLFIRGKRAETFAEAGIEVGPFTEGVVLK